MEKNTLQARQDRNVRKDLAGSPDFSFPDPRLFTTLLESKVVDDRQIPTSEYRT